MSTSLDKVTDVLRTTSVAALSAAHPGVDIVRQNQNYQPTPGEPFFVVETLYGESFPKSVAGVGLNSPTLGYVWPGVHVIRIFVQQGSLTADLDDYTVTAVGIFRGQRVTTSDGKVIRLLRTAAADAGQTVTVGKQTDLKQRNVSHSFTWEETQ